MAGVLERMRRSRKQPVKSGIHLSAIPSKALELEIAKEILAEVFRVRLSEVDEMIQIRFKATCREEIGSKEDSLWPQELWVQG